MGGAYDSEHMRTPAADSRLRSGQDLTEDSQIGNGRILADASDIQNKNGANSKKYSRRKLIILQIIIRRRITLKKGSSGGQYAPPVFVRRRRMKTATA